MKYTNRVKRLVVFPNEPISAYHVKGEIKERYFNPCNLFDEVHVISPSDKDVDAEKVRPLAGSAALTIHPVGYLSTSSLFHPRSGVRKMLTTKRRVQQLIENIQPGVIRAYNPLMQGLLAVLSGTRLGVPVVVSLHGDYDEERLFMKEQRGPRDFLEFYFGSRLTEAYCLRKANAVIAVTEFVASYARRHGARRVSVIYNRVDTDRFAPRKTTNHRERFAIISVGRQTAQKNQACLIRALKNIDADLILIGDGELHDSLVTMARDLDMSARVKFIKSVSHSEIHNLFSLSDAFAIASRFEGFCIPVLEAMACSLPVIVADIPPLREIVGDAGILVPHRQEAFEEAFRTLMTDNKLRETLAEKARRRAIQFNGKVMEQIEADLYMQLLREREQSLSVLADQFEYLEKGPARHLHKARMDLLTSEIRQASGGKEHFTVLDLGCGDGVVASYIKRILRTQDKLLCLDIALERLRKAQRNCPKASIVASDVRALPIKSVSCDLVVLHHVIEHIDGDRALLNECRRIIKGDGTILIGVPNEGGRVGSLLRRIHKQQYGKSEHINFYSTETMKNLIQSSGFLVTDVSLFGFIFPFFPVHYWILRNRPIFSLGNRLTQVLRFTADSLMFTARKVA